MTGRPLRRAARVPLSSQTQGEAVVRSETRNRGQTVNESSRTTPLPAADIDPSERGEVSIKHGRTIDLGNFNGARIDVQVTLPCTVATVQEVALEAHDHLVAIFQAEEEYLLGYTNTAAPQRRANRRG